MDIVVKGRNVEVPEHFRQHVADKLAPSERLDARALRVDVELAHERNPRQAAKCQRLEITVASKGPVIRAEACAETFYAALDTAVLKLEARLRKQHDRRRVHHGGKTPPSVAEVTASLPLDLPPVGADGPVALLERPTAQSTEPLDGTGASDGRADDTRSLIVRDKTHEARPMTVEDALHEMELVGHDFYLFMDAERALPSVVYRRHGYDYGVLRLATS